METIFNALTFLGNEFALFIISMIPLIELRGAVILGAALDMNWVIVLIVSVIGNMVPIPFLLLFGRKILDWLKTVPLFSKLAHWYEEKLVKKADQINEYAKCCLLYTSPAHAYPKRRRSAHPLLFAVRPPREKLFPYTLLFYLQIQ